VTPGGTAEVSIYVDKTLNVNGYFKKDAAGNWVNLATSVLNVGSKTKITFSLTDGGVYDSDHLANGSIVDPGGLGTVAPLIGSDGGAPLARIGVLEGRQEVTKIVASATGPVNYTIVGGDDAALFSVDPVTGVLRFKAVPDYDFPQDAGHDNVYEVQVRAADAYGSDVQTIQVSVADVAPPAREIDGVQVVTGSRGNGDGTSSQVIAIPVVQPGRVESVGNNSVADVPLVAGGDGKPVLSAQVPTGVGLQVSGTAAPVGVNDALTNLIREIKGVTVSGSHDQASMTGGGSGFLSSLPADANLLVHTVVPTIAAGSTAAQPVVISGLAPSAGGAMSALVIDAHLLPSGSEIQLQDVAFAAVVGNVRVTGGAGSQTVWADGGSQYIVLGADDDTLHGGDGDDTDGSEGGNDHIYGDGGNDVVFGGEGNDYVDGGTGIDTVQMVGGGRADYSLRVNGDGNLVFTHLNGGADGTDVVANVEVLRFMNAHADTSLQGSVMRLAQAVSGTAASSPAVQGWMSELKAGATLEQVAQHILAASAAQQPAGDADFVQALYAHTFGRTADAGGLAFWTGALASGQLTRAGVALAVADSAEKLAMPGVSQIEVGATDYGTLVRMYDTLFGRSADVDGINYWLGRSEAGASLAAIADGFVHSAEAQARFGKMSDTQFVEELYHVAMHRDASQVEVSGWTKLLASGALDRGGVLLQFTESAEKAGLVGVMSTSFTPDGHA
jgi:Ca2+-binding RTX toxin-like protein